MAGLCIIARQSSKELQPWRCLNLAVATCRDSNRKQVILTPGGAVVPVPLHNQFGLRSAMITYNNRPLMGRSAEMDFGDSWTGTSETSDEFTRLIEYLHPSILPAGTADRKLPGLAFGQSYDFLAGIVRSSGALPELFAAKGNPGQLLLNNDPSKTEFTKMYIDYHQTVQYLRTVPVSELRFGRFDVANPDDSGSNKALGLPIIPAGVLPRAFEYPQAKKDAAPTEGTEKESPQPVVLLTDYTGSRPRS